MHLIKERLDIEESLEKRIKTILKFLNIKSKIERGNIISIKNTNLFYIEPHNLVIDNITYLFFRNSYQKIANILNKENVLNKKWLDTTILKILSNPLYKGDFISGARVGNSVLYENVVEPIVSKNL